MSRWTIFALAIAAGACGARVENPKTLHVSLVQGDFVLPNGLRVVVHHEPTAQTAAVRVRYHVGSKDDPPGRAGLAHLFEHLMFRESARLGPGDYMERLEAGGVIEANASTTHDRTDYHEVVPPSQLAYALWLEAGRMAYPAADIDAASFSKERDVVENELREHYENTPYGNVYGIALRAIYGSDHPYGHPTIGALRDLDRATLADVRAFGAQHYRPNNATLVVCGPFAPEATKRLVVAAFGRIPGGAVAPRRTFRPVALKESSRIDAVARVDAPMVALAWPAPPPGAEGYDELELALPLVEGHIHRILVVEKKVAEDVTFDLDVGHLGSLAFLEIKLKPGESPESAVSVVEGSLFRLSRLGRVYTFDGYPDYLAKRLILHVGGLESLDRRASRILFDLDHHGVADGMQDELRRIQDIPIEEVGSAIYRFLADAPRVTIVVAPDASAPRAGRVR